MCIDLRLSQVLESDNTKCGRDEESLCNFAPIFYVIVLNLNEHSESIRDLSLTPGRFHSTSSLPSIAISFVNSESTHSSPAATSGGSVLLLALDRVSSTYIRRAISFSLSDNKNGAYSMLSQRCPVVPSCGIVFHCVHACSK